MPANAAKHAAKITDEVIEIASREIGVKSTMPQYNRVATEDAVAHYALGIGDDNPRWMDMDYATKTPSGPVAPATFVFTSGWPRSRGMPGIHGLFSGVDLVCHRPVPIGARIKVTTELDQMIEHQGRYAGRTVQQIYKTIYSDEAGEPYSTLYSHAFRTERSTGGKSKKYSEIEPQSYDDQALAAIGSLYKQEKIARAGSTPRYFEDVEVGQKISPIVKGPLTITDCICFLMGFGYIYVKAHRQWYEFLQRHPAAGTKNEYGIWDIPERVHWENDFARDIGMPAAYDYGPQRIAWFDHLVSDWIGDHGFIRKLGVQLRAPNFIGDTTYLSGTIVGKNEEEGTVSLELLAEDQRGRMTAKGTSEVLLPRKA